MLRWTNHKSAVTVVWPVTRHWENNEVSWLVWGISSVHVIFSNTLWFKAKAIQIKGQTGLKDQWPRQNNRMLQANMWFLCCNWHKVDKKKKKEKRFGQAACNLKESHLNSWKTHCEWFRDVIAWLTSSCTLHKVDWIEGLFTSLLFFHQRL